MPAGVVGGAAWLHSFDDRSMNVAGRLHLLPQLGSHVGETQAPPRLAMIGAGGFAALAVTASHFLQGYRDAHALAVSQNLQLDGRARMFLSNFNLKLASVSHLLAREVGDYVTHLQASLRSRGTSLD